MSTDLENEEAAADEERMIAILQGHAPTGSKLRITQVTFGTPVGIGNYENERFGATAEVQAGQDPREVMGELIDWVSRRAGRPTRAEKAAANTLEKVDNLYGALRTAITSVKWSEKDISRLSQNLAAIRTDPAAESATNQRYIKDLEQTLASAQEALQKARATIDLKTNEIQAAERQPEIIAARSLLQRPMPMLPASGDEATEADDDIPC